MVQIAYGSTPPGNTNWVQYGVGGIYVDIDTSSANFSTTPLYFTSVGGTTRQWDLVGITAIYSQTNKGFRVYARKFNGGAVDPSSANQDGWHINWFGIVS